MQRVEQSKSASCDIFIYIYKKGRAVSRSNWKSDEKKVPFETKVSKAVETLGSMYLSKLTEIRKEEEEGEGRGKRNSYRYGLFGSL